MNTMIEIYDRIMGVVEEVTGISKDKILTSNCEECVDARHILVYILGNRSFSDNKIAELTGLTRPGVCIIRNNFKYRRKRYFVNLNFLTENEAEEIVAAFQNQDGSKGPKWRDPDELFEKVEQHDGRVECEPYYNKWALYVAMNKAASDQNSVILKWIGDDKDKYIIACYDLALTDLKDKDRPYWIRKYFHVESKF